MITPVSEDKGHFRCYRAKKFTRDHLRIIKGVNEIITEYEAQGFSLTLRQIYYQFVSRDWMANKQSEYDRLGGIISEGRIAGLISWTAIEDRNRTLRGYNTFRGPKEAMQNVIQSYKRDLWEEQEWRPEVWVEKAALEGVVGSICSELRVNYFAIRGYNSQSEQWRAGQRFADYLRRGQRPIVFHLGDHDPSGLDMTRDNRDRLEMFAGVPVMVQRLALNMSQIEQYNPPPNPAKSTDSRYEEYRQQYGEESWELDALSPVVMRDLISNAIMRIRNHKIYDQMLAREVAEIRMLKTLSEDML